MDISDFIGAAKTFHVLGIKVTKDGDLINEWYSEPECRRNIYSATKSFTSCAVGFAVQEGLLSLDEKLTDAFPEDLPDVIDDNLKMATGSRPAYDVFRTGTGQPYGRTAAIIPRG